MFGCSKAVAKQCDSAAEGRRTRTPACSGPLRRCAISLLLVGTVHLDPHGYESLLGLLEAQKPSAITVEFSRYGLEFRRTRAPSHQQRLLAFKRTDGSLPAAIEAVYRQLDLPFEYQAASDFGRLHGVDVELVGDDDLSRRLLEHLELELLATDNLRALAKRDEPPLSVQVDREWQRARRLFRAGPVQGSIAARRLAESDRPMAERIRKRAGLNHIHVGGFEHLSGLAALLGDLSPTLRLLRP